MDSSTISDIDLAVCAADFGQDCDPNGHTSNDLCLLFALPLMLSKAQVSRAPGSCARDEGGPLAAGLQDLAAKRLALRW